MYFYTLVAVVTALSSQRVVSQGIDPSSIDDATKAKWCNDQTSACPLICLQLPGASGLPEQNDCTASSLSYSCVCSNGQQPNASQYSQTIPYYECTQAATDCVNNCAQGDSSCQSACRNDHPCGAQHPVMLNLTSSSTTASTTAGSSSTSTAGSTSTNSFTGVGGGSGGTSNASRQAQAFALGFGTMYGLAIVLGGICTGLMLVS